MELNKQNFFWGMLLIGAGILALIQHYVGEFSPEFWILVYAAISLFAFITYALSGWRQWGWLFPTGVFGGLAVTIVLAISGVESAAVASPLFIGLIIPFAVVYFMDRARNWWALIPGGVMVFLTLTTLLVDTLGGEWIGALLFFMVAISFLIVYLSNQTRIWALIVAYATGVLGIAPLMAIGGGDNAAYFGPIFFFAVALPFFVLYFRSAQRWWAIIPAGTLTTIAIVATFAITGTIQSEQEGAIMGAVIMGGLAATFAVVWLRNGRPWARTATIVLAVLAALSFFFVSQYQVYGSVAIILAGGYLLFRALRAKSA